jgi:hypothetical protein
MVQKRQETERNLPTKPSLMTTLHVTVVTLARKTKRTKRGQIYLFVMPVLNEYHDRKVGGFI